MNLYLVFVFLRRHLNLMFCVLTTDSKIKPKSVQNQIYVNNFELLELSGIK